MFAIAAAVWMVTRNANDALPQADSVRAVRIIGLAFGTQHEVFRTQFLTGCTPKLPPAFPRRFLAKMLSSRQPDALYDVFWIVGE